MPQDSLRHRHKRLAICTISSVSIILTLAVLLFSYAVAYQSVHPAKRRISRTPAQFSLKFENIDFNSLDGTRLRGWFIPAPQAQGVIICCHGYPGNRSDQLGFISFLRRAGFSTFAFDFRALGESGGQASTIGFKETEDALAAVAYLRQRPDTRNQPIGIFGLSMGAAVALMAAERSPEIKAVVADSPYASLDHAIGQHFRGLGLFGPLIEFPTRKFGERMIGHNAADVSPLRDISKISPRPLLLIHGTEDKVIPPADSRLLFKAAGQPKQLWLIPNCPHGGGYDVTKAIYEQRVVQFFRAALE